MLKSFTLSDAYTAQSADPCQQNESRLATLGYGQMPHPLGQAPSGWPRLLAEFSALDSPRRNISGSWSVSNVNLDRPDIMNSDESALQVRGLTKRFDRPAVDALDLTVRAGEFYALVGPNGAGKTTTLRMV